MTSLPSPALLAATLELASELDLSEALRIFVRSACTITGARYGALSVLDNRGETAQFVQHGMSSADAALLPHPPLGHGVIGAIPDHGTLRIDSLDGHPQFSGFPAGHPPMENYLGTALRLRDQTFGRLYLCDKEGGFSAADATNVETLAAAAAVAVQNARLFAEARNRGRWLSASQQITTTLLQGTEEEEALALIARLVREVAEADTALIVLPSIGQSWVCEIADGHEAAGLIGIQFPPQGRAVTVLRDGAGLVVDSLARARTLRVPQLARFGPALYAPLMARGSGIGVLILLRRRGRMEFARSDLEMAESFAAQAALALEFASARHAEDRAALLDERARIGRDLHDLAIQQLFATGMQLETARAGIARGEENQQRVEELLNQALTSVDDSVRQIRAIVRSLKEPDQEVDLPERIRREASLARTALGFAPSFTIELDGVSLAGAPNSEELTQQVSDRVDSDISDDVVAVVREGLSNAARHARAASVQVRVAVSGHGLLGHVLVEVLDDGVGVPADRTRNSGLENLAARARRHRGTFTVGRTETGAGTHLVWQVPLT